ncbi:patatin-like phospholipase family protein [Myxococcaceae bacterium GXIMD 01537]
MLAVFTTALLLAAQPETPTPPVPPARSESPLAAVFSGGVSLGNYEAGLAWTSVRFMRAARMGGQVPPRQPLLTAVTGASAGSVNALVAALLWCESAETAARDTVDRNPLRDLWLPVGLEQLLPEDLTRYLPGDALLSTRPLTVALESLGQEVLGPHATRRFTPGCRLPVGLTVTRATPEERRIAGLPTLTQKFVVPWALEVTRDGQPRFVRQPLTSGRDAGDNTLSLSDLASSTADSPHLGWEQMSQAVLTSGAFPVAFGPRALCDCTAECPASETVGADACPGPSGALPPRSCAAQSPRDAPLKLCSRRYVDGGIFDNAPVGLAIDLTESTQAPAPLRPVRYVFVDPDLRRLSPTRTSTPEASGANGRGVTAGLQLVGSLISTGRNVELARAARAGNWNLTTQSLLRETAAGLLPYIFIHVELNTLESGATTEPLEPPAALRTLAQRHRLGRLLFECLSPEAASAAQQRSCAQRILVLSQQENAAEDTPPLSAEEVVRLADLAASRVVQENPRLAPPAPPAGVAHEDFIERLIIGTATLYYFAEEVERVGNSSLPEERLLRFKRSVLGMVQLGRQLASLTNTTANALLVNLLEGLARREALAPTANEARRQVQGLAPGELFSSGDVQPVLTALSALAPEPQVSASPDAVVRLLRLVQLHPQLLHTNSLALAHSREARELMGQRGGERELVLSSRFSPLASSHLYNFAGFLDLPLREFDYYAGVYDALHTIGVMMCGAAELGLGPVVRRLDAPNELDVSAPDTQRCIGEAMRQTVETLGLSASPKARYVAGRLARMELAAALDDSAFAASMLREPSWAWLEAFGTAEPGANLVAVTEALLSKRASCTPTSKEALCVVDVSFDAFIQGLREHGYVPQSDNLRQAMEDQEAWEVRTVRRVVDRSLLIERAEPPSDPSMKGAVLLAHSAGQLWLRRAEDVTPTFPRFVLDPSTIPATPPEGAWMPRAAAHLIPYRLSLDVARGGFALAWLEPALHLSSRVSLLSIVEVLDFQAESDRISTTLGVRPTLRLGGLALGAGPRLSLPWVNGNGVALGGEVRLGVLQDRLAISAGVRRLSAAKSTSNEGFIALSVSDLNGLAYWLMF